MVLAIKTNLKKICSALKAELFITNIKLLLKREAFYCKALNGQSDYNICINSDMTVSCNCVDVDGSGQIGDLSRNTLIEIFGGEIASKFRAFHAKGMIPIKRCLMCRELIRISTKDSRKYLTNYVTPKHGIMVENTALCNLKCVNCSRSTILKTRKKYKLSLADIEKIAINIRDSQVKLVHYFNLGEPFLSDTAYDEIEILRKYNPNIMINVSTNGLLLNLKQNKEAALLLDYMFISLDGATNESVNKYQVGGDFEITYNNIKEFVKFRNARKQQKPVIEWKYVVFKWNDSESEIEKAIELAKQAEVDVISFWLGTGTPDQVSKKFTNSEFFKTLGTASWKGREFDFRAK